VVVAVIVRLILHIRCIAQLPSSESDWTRH
jgi:hypothetical protein